MKRLVLHSLRRAGLLGAADRVHFGLHRLASARGNRRFVDSRPDYAVPPTHVAFDAYGHVSWEEYRTTGEAHARLIAGLIGEALPVGRLRVLEWGCGAGRILRHLHASAIGGRVELHGMDVDREAVDWCTHHLPGIAFALCGPEPPLAIADASFDVVYHYSVWTHLSEAAMKAWADEMLRILKPGGVMIGTTHGDAYLPMLFGAERDRYRADIAVTRVGANEGRKHFLSFHSPAYIRALLSPQWREVRHLPGSDSRAFPQDVWIARR